MRWPTPKRCPGSKPNASIFTALPAARGLAAALSNRIDGLQGAVLRSGAYDLARLYQDSPSFWLRRTRNPQDEKQPKLQNLLPQVADRHVSTLVLHGAQDTLIPVSQAILLHDRQKSLANRTGWCCFPDLAVAGRRTGSNSAWFDF